MPDRPGWHANCRGKMVRTPALGPELILNIQRSGEQVARILEMFDDVSAVRVDEVQLVPFACGGAADFVEQTSR